MNKKIIIDYTLKKFSGFKSIDLPSEKEAAKWLKANKEELYWYSKRHENAESSRPRLVVDKNIPLDDYVTISGTLETFYETGMECTGLVIYDETKFGPKNPSYDESRPEDGSNFKFFKTMEGTHFINRGSILQVGDGERVLMEYDPEFAKNDGHRLSFYPQGYSRKELIDLFRAGSVRATLWIMKTKLK